MKRNIEAIKKRADKIIKFDQISFPKNSLGYRIASAHIRTNGFYAYTNCTTNEKVFVEA